MSGHPPSIDAPLKEASGPLSFLGAEDPHDAPSGKEIDTTLWPGCKSVGCVVSQLIVGEKVAELEERYYISSCPISAEQLARTVRAH